MTSTSPTPPDGDFEPFEAGPFAWLPRLVPLAPQYDAHGVRRALIAALVSWVPLALLAAIEGVAFRPGNARESLLTDFSAYGRYLLATPALTYAGSSILPQLASVVRQFLESDLIREGDRDRYLELVYSTRRLLRMRAMDLSILALAFVVAVLRSPAGYSLDVATWAVPASAGAAIRHLSLAGWWRTLVSQPLFNALLAVWLWRLLLWVRLVFRVSRMDLRLVAAHPDLLGGLRFILIPIRGFAILAFAVGATAAGTVAQRVLVDGQALASFQLMVLTQVVVAEIIFAGPFLIWMMPLVELHQTGTLAYGQLASRVGQAFQERWLAPRRNVGPDALEAPDFSATTDLFAIVANVASMNLYVLDVTGLALIAVASLLPYVPLVLAVMPLNDILKFAVSAFS